MDSDTIIWGDPEERAQKMERCLVPQNGKPYWVKLTEDSNWFISWVSQNSMGHYFNTPDNGHLTIDCVYAWELILEPIR